MCKILPTVAKGICHSIIANLEGVVLTRWHTTRARLKDAAGIAGVSIRTVSRVINNSPEVSANTRARVLDVIKQLNYHPSSLGRRLSAGRSKTIGLNVPLTFDYVASDYFFLDIILGINRILTKNDYDLQIITMDEAGQDGRSCLNLFHEGRIEGLILMDPCVEDRLIAALQAENAPFVLIGRPPDEVLCNYVDNDNVKGAADLVDHLAGLGHEKIAIIAGMPELTVAQDWILGYRIGMRKNHLPERDDYVSHSQFTVESGRYEIGRVLHLTDRPTAVITGNDLLAVGAIRGAREMGVWVPEDLSVVTFNDTPLTRYFAPPITAMHGPITELAMRAADMLLAMLHGGEQERVVVIPCQLTVRDSSSAPPV